MSLLFLVGPLTCWKYDSDENCENYNYLSRYILGTIRKSVICDIY